MGLIRDVVSQMKVSVRPNQGLFALEDIAKNRIICDFGGRKIHRARKHNRARAIPWDDEHVFVWFSQHSRDNTRKIAQFAQDSFQLIPEKYVSPLEKIGNYYLDNDNNAKYAHVVNFDGETQRIVLLSTRDIRAGDEIFACFESRYWVEKIEYSSAKVKYQIAQAAFEGLVDLLLLDTGFIEHNYFQRISSKVALLSQPARAELRRLCKTNLTYVDRYVDLTFQGYSFSIFDVVDCRPIQIKCAADTGDTD